MNRLLILAVAGWLSVGIGACNKGPPHPETPTAVVEALFVRMNLVRDAGQRTGKDGSTEEDATNATQSTAALDALFLNPKKAKLIMMPLVFLDLEEVEFVNETIDGDNAEVTIEHTVVGFGQRVELAESAQTTKQVTFQLKKDQGRWKISDLGGILGKYGR